MRLTINSLNKAFPDYNVSFIIVGGRRSYSILHKPSGKVSACVLGWKLSTVHGVLKQCESMPKSDTLNPLNRGDYFGIPERKWQALVQVEGTEPFHTIMVHGKDYDSAMNNAIGYGFKVFELIPMD